MYGTMEEKCEEFQAQLRCEEQDWLRKQISEMTTEVNRLRATGDEDDEAAGLNLLMQVHTLAAELDD